MNLNFSTNKIEGEKIITSDGIIKQNDNTQLVVILHGVFFVRKWQLLSPLIKAIDDIYDSKANIWAPQLPYSRLFAWEKPEDIVKKLQEDLDEIWIQGQYTSLRIVGHSFGGVYARALILQGLEHKSPWSECKDIRLVLLAAVNCGVGISRHMNLWMVIGFALGIVLGRLIQIISIGKYEVTIVSGMRGSKFITKMRLDWLEKEQKQKQKQNCIHSLPRTIQLLGSIDGVVSPKDNIDLATGSNFHYLDVPFTSHTSILKMTVNQRTTEQESVINKRKEILETALKKTCDEIKDEEVRPWELKRIDKDKDKDKDEQKRRDQVKHVVFVIHGIRDEGHWTDKIARRVWNKAKKNNKDLPEKVVDSYGYFGMGPFLIPGVRWKKVTWLMEQYLEARAKYPQAKFSYIGHSHGTYVLAKALENYEQCRFHNVVFAGSIVRENYDWQSLIDNGQVSRVLNFVATWDWVVAWFPNFLGLYNLQDLGGASHNGFNQATQKGPIYNIEYAKGDHGAGKREELWDTIADFILMEDGDSLSEDLSKFIKDGKNSDSDKQVMTFSLSLLIKKGLYRLVSLLLQEYRNSNLALTNISSRLIYVARELFGLLNILVWNLIITVFLVLMPILIMRWWRDFAWLISLLISHITSTVGLIILSILALVFVLLYGFNACRQKEKYDRKEWDVRSFVLFPTAFLLNFLGATWFILWLLDTPYFKDVKFPPIEMWSPAAIVIWISFVIWGLSKI